MKILINKICAWNFCALIITSTLSCSIVHKNNSSIQKPHEIQIEFYSKGAGIDFKSKKLLEEFIVNFNETNNTNITYTVTKTGKEGETNYYITLDKLEEQLKQKFISEIKNQLQRAKNTRLTIL